VKVVVIPFLYSSISLQGMLGAALAILPFLSHLCSSRETHTKAEKPAPGLTVVVWLKSYLPSQPVTYSQGQMPTDCTSRNFTLQEPSDKLSFPPV